MSRQLKDHFRLPDTSLNFEPTLCNPFPLMLGLELTELRVSGMVLSGDNR